MARESKKIFAICENPNCDKEFSFIPSRKQKYCEYECYKSDPRQKLRRRSAMGYLYMKD